MTTTSARAAILAAMILPFLSGVAAADPGTVGALILETFAVDAAVAGAPLLPGVTVAQAVGATAHVEPSTALSYLLHMIRWRPISTDTRP
jgi:hypothetical protein